MKKLYAYLLIALILLVSVMAATRNSFVNQNYHQNSLYNISNLTWSGNASDGTLYIAGGNIWDALEINATRFYQSGSLLLSLVTLGIISATYWDRDNATDHFGPNGSILRTSNLTTEGICRTGSGCNVTDLNVTGLLNISEGFKGGFEIATLHDLTAGNVTITTELEVRNDEPVTLNRGDPVYFTSYISGLSLQGVEFANNTQISTHADCIIAETIATNARGQCVETGHVIQMDTSSFSFGDDLYLDTGGNLTPEKPINAECIQKVGMVLRSHASQGVIWTHSMDRCNDVPKDVNITGNVTADTVFAHHEGSANITTGSVIKLPLGWTNLTKYPAACNTGYFISTLGDSVPHNSNRSMLFRFLQTSNYLRYGYKIQ